MQTIIITGGRTLQGTVCPESAKNSVLPLMAAALLCRGRVTLHSVPRLADVETSIALLRAVGADVQRCGADLVLCTDTPLYGQIPARLSGAMRSSVFYLAPLLCRTGTVRLPLPGGCRLGPRPVDIHLAGLTALGATVELEGDAATLRAADGLRGADFTLRLPSVGATLTLMMAACCAVGTTVLRGAACEPEVADTARFLSCCGADIQGAGTPTLVIQGAKTLTGTAYTPMPDRIAAATYGAALACVGGEVTVAHCSPRYYASFLEVLQKCGVEISCREDSVTLFRNAAVPLHGGHSLCANAWPALATDTAPLAAAVLLQADAPSEIYDALFARRFACAAGFAAMGAVCSEQGRRLQIQGSARLHGAEVSAPDLRGGAALLLAALAAEGTTLLHDAGHLARGYTDLPGHLAALGADIR